MFKTIIFAIFVVAAFFVGLNEAQNCNPALIDPDGTAVCPTGTVLNSTASTCCSTTSTSGCLPALSQTDGSFVCPSTLTLTGTQCCPTTSTNTTTCVDLTNPRTGVSDCPSRAYLCNNATYLTLMTQQCPRTCGRCSSSTTSTGTSTTTCVDLTNPSTGTSDCPSRAYLCTNTAYLTLMRQQCPRTCGFCTTGKK